MKRIIYTLVIALTAISAVAQSPQQMLDKAVAALKGSVSADYQVKTKQGTMTGSIVINGNKFRLLSKDIKCWYDGKTQWTYSTATQEVNVTTPTAAELSTTNPMAAAQSFKKNFNMWKASGQIPGHYAIMLKPKAKSEISQVYLYLSDGSNLLHNAHFKMADGTTFTITLTNYKTKSGLPGSTFTYDASLVPAGTQVIDLR